MKDFVSDILRQFRMRVEFSFSRFSYYAVVVPGNRPDWAENALDAADHSKCVKFVVAISLIISPSDTFFGANYNDMEMEAKVRTYCWWRYRDVFPTIINSLLMTIFSDSFLLDTASFACLS